MASIALPPVPADLDASISAFFPHAFISAPVIRSIEPAGPQFLAHARRTRHNRTFSEDDRIQAGANVKKVEDEGDESEEESETAGLLSQDPKEWKQQDHYAVLGLSKYRYKATDDQIKRAYRRKVLKHHPDKKASSGNVNDDSFFKCIQKAMEVLSDPIRRSQFDSVDEGANVDPPSKKQAAKGNNFYKLWGRVFEAEGRFSKRRPVPVLGNEDSTREQVEQFYDFWYKFDSWRSFEYLDKDIPDDSDNRDNKRYQEKKNKAERARKKTEDTARLRKLVDDCLEQDKRIAMFKQKEKEEKERRKWDREAGARQAAEEAKKTAEEEVRKQEEQEMAEKNKALEAKKNKEAQKKAAKKDKRIIKGSLKDCNYFAISGESSPAMIDSVLNEVDAVLANMQPEEMSQLAQEIEGKSTSTDIKKAIDNWANALVRDNRLKSTDFKIFKAPI
ncbi:Zuotin [Neolecta irregularis DAH-3]|uniref:Zuotin n=1 Tax=Neolecta irregularis (strain DAH-3) TaxID=1198029 RepID=A0A1U7LVH4_NEOID|nr:Zuotin [Neolecta irregularis DAH-3]|eukprot:OLL26573.1 Zuotin [Neolecta irregularis DAH-3]